jgi:hypothetical protein
MHTTHVGYMQKVSGVLGDMREDGHDEHNGMLSGLRGLMQSKYGDIILLSCVTFAFGMLLAVSAIG